MVGFIWGFYSIYAPPLQIVPRPEDFIPAASCTMKPTLEIVSELGWACGLTEKIGFEQGASSAYL